jgi:glycosyltransferase involved in cell wall biosynthesis
MPEPRVSIICSLYKGEKYLSSYFENVRAQTIFNELEIVLVHNEPSSLELAIIKDFSGRYPHQLKHLAVENVEPLGASWNRGWQAVSSDRVAIWNVDDRRVPDSLWAQTQSFLAWPDAIAVYGDYIEVPQVGMVSGTKRRTPQFDRKTFLRSFPQGGAFMVYRRDLIDRIGGFDEQLPVGPDMEYSFRIAAAGLGMARAEGVLGYFTNVLSGLSTRESGQPAARDRAAVQLRYAVYDKIDVGLLDALKDFRPDEILVNNVWQPLEKYWMDVKSYRESKQGLWILGKLRRFFRLTLNRLGLLEVIHALQRRLTHRDL